MGKQLSKWVGAQVNEHAYVVHVSVLSFEEVHKPSQDYVLTLHQ